MQFDILTLFPGMFTGPLTESIIKRAVQAGLISIGIHDIRAYTTDRHHTADDSPFGGGAGLVLKAEPIFDAVADVVASTNSTGSDRPWIVLLAAQGRRFDQSVAQELAGRTHVILICGHYE